jgi:hypothetical protein
MLEGIRYYPKKEKLNRSKLLILIVLPIALIVVLWFFYQQFEPNTSKSTTIVIEPKIVEEAVEASPEIIKEKLDSPEIEINSKGLDEVVDSYEASTQNQ